MARRCKGDSAPFPTFAAENRFALCYHPRMTPNDKQRFAKTISDFVEGCHSRARFIL